MKLAASLLAGLLVLAVPTPTLSQADNNAISIHDIQGASHISPLKGKKVTAVPGVVTALMSNGFYLQDPTPDNTDNTSEGIFVFTSRAPTVAVGDAVEVNATVQEFRPGGKQGVNNLTVTELAKPTVTVTSHGNTLPAPTIIGSGGRVPPDTVIEDDATGDVETSGTFDPSNDGIDFYESLEGMRVQVNNAVVVGPTNRFGEVFVVGDNGQYATIRTARGGIVISPTDFNPERIMVSDVLIRAKSKMPALNVGDKFTSPIVGVLGYDFGNYDILATDTIQAQSGGLKPEVIDAASSDHLSVGTFNVQNLSALDPDTKFDTLASLITTNLKAPDIVAVEEIQDNSGAVDNGVVDADQTLTKLIAAVKAAGGPTYDFRQINPVNDKDGGQPGGNIRQVFLFNPARVNFVDRSGGSSTAKTMAIVSDGQVMLSFSPGRIDPQNPVWKDSRKPLVGQFMFNGRIVFVIANHFVAKLGDQPLFGHYQPPTFSSESQRVQQASVVHNFVQSILDIDSNANIIVLGDLNDYEFSNTITTLKGNLLDNLMETLPKNERYSYVFEGNSEVLDQMLVSRNLTNTAAPAYDVVHINAEFAVQSSDHDPSVGRFKIK